MISTSLKKVNHMPTKPMRFYELFHSQKKIHPKKLVKGEAKKNILNDSPHCLEYPILSRG